MQITSTILWCSSTSMTLSFCCKNIKACWLDRLTGVLVLDFAHKDASFSKALSILRSEGTMRFDWDPESLSSFWTANSSWHAKHCWRCLACLPERRLSFRRSDCEGPTWEQNTSKPTSSSVLNRICMQTKRMLDNDPCQDWFSTDLSSGIWGLGFSLVLRPECCVAGIVLPKGWEGWPSA